MTQKFARRQFLKAAGAVPLASLALSPPSTGRAAPMPAHRTPTGGESSHKVRIATIQMNRVPQCDGLRTDPFSPEFSLRDLMTSIDRRGLADRMA